MEFQKISDFRITLQDFGELFSVFSQFDSADFALKSLILRRQPARVRSRRAVRGPGMRWRGALLCAALGAALPEATAAASAARRPRAPSRGVVPM